jgi:hypothetical protein
LQVSAVSPITTSTFSKATSSSSATICAIATSRHWPMSILPKNVVTRPSGSIAIQESSSVGSSAGFALPAGICARASPMKTGPEADTIRAPDAFRNSRRERDGSRRAFMDSPYAIID